MDAALRAVAVPRKSPGEPSDAYLGLLYPTEDFKVFGCAARPTPVKGMAGRSCGPDWLTAPGRRPVSQALAALHPVSRADHTWRCTTAFVTMTQG